ncbi:MAG: SpoIIE family protein phosphatase [Motilibacteraceae bacterium]
MRGVPTGDGALVDDDLERQVALLGAMVEQSPLGLAIFDDHLRFRTVNAALARINGMPVEEHLGRRVPELLPHMDAAVEDVMRRVLETGVPATNVLHRGRTPADPRRDRVFEVTYSRIDAEDGRALGVAAFATDVTARHEALQAVSSAQFRLALLDEASARVGTSLDLRRTAEELCDIAVPRFADHAAVDLLDSLLAGEEGPLGAPGTRMTRMAFRSHDEHLADRFPVVTASLDYPADAPAARAIATGRPQLVDPVDDEFVRRTARNDDEVHAVLAVGVGSAVVVPLVARGAVLGVASFVRNRESRTFDAQDLALAAELGHRAGLAMDNARLYTRERATALALQRHLLPPDEQRVQEVEVASRYLPGVSTTEVGGDWFDVIPLAGGRVALVVGDVMGRGVRAAAAMGQLRTAVRTLAVLDLMPEDVVAHLDDLAQSLAQVQLATCIYAVYDPVTRELRWASAGHLPPVLVPPDGPATLLPIPSGAPLGVGGVAFESACVQVPDGTRVVLYTDGLVESRGLDLDHGLDALREALDTAPDDLDALCDDVLTRLGRDAAHDDDVALLAARLHALPERRAESWEVPSDLAAVSRARALTRAALADWGLEPLDDTATLLVSELVTNAIRYAKDPVELRLLLLDDRLEVSVADHDTRLPRLMRADADAEGGRGLHLVGTLARRWGARSTADGKVVWFDVPLPGRV